MNVENIRLINFRNYKSLNIKLNEKINIFVGKNAQGKTNLLESIYICATGRSFRTNKDKEIINLDKNEAYIGANIKTDRSQKFIEIKMERDKQKRIQYKLAAVITTAAWTAALLLLENTFLVNCGFSTILIQNIQLVLVKKPKL